MTDSIFQYGPWHKWFAWHPVKTKLYGWRWLRTVLRRRTWTSPLAPGPYLESWQYTVPTRGTND